jgi:prepilin-type N-terminal cleavage/methylation domain-containing protein
MRTMQRHNLARAGFTLIELLVVIAIITVLLSLLLAGIFKLLAIPDREQNRHDISKLQDAASEFHKTYKMYPPSRILLSNDPAQYVSHADGPASKIILNKIWPKLDLTKPIDWSNNNPTTTYAEVLEGHQCLVFFLGGAPATGGQPGTFGFSDSPSNPIPSTMQTPFYRFKAERLVKIGASNFFSYLDAYGQQPIAYFSTGIKGDNQYQDGDCTGLNVKPYYSATSPFTKYYNPKTFQIISAGEDGQFGLITDPYDQRLGNAPPGGDDDQANFHDANLGAGKS